MLGAGTHMDDTVPAPQVLHVSPVEVRGGIRAKPESHIGDHSQKRDRRHSRKTEWQSGPKAWEAMAAKSQMAAVRSHQARGGHGVRLHRWARPRCCRAWDTISKGAM